MPADFWNAAAKMATSGLLVAAVAVPAALAARALRPRGEPLLPPWKPWRVPWGGYAVLVAFFSLELLPLFASDLLTATGFYQRVHGLDFPARNAEGVSPARSQDAALVRGLWAGLFSLPVSLGLLWLAARAAYPKWDRALLGRGSGAGQVWLAILAWLAVTPAVLAMNRAVNELVRYWGGVPDEHDLTRLAHGPVLGRVLLVVSACATAPLKEELFFRGILLPWCVGRSALLAPGVAAGSAGRPWLVMVAAAVLVSLPVLRGGSLAPVLFVGVLAVGLAVLWRVQPSGARRARAVYASAAMFAAVHSAVWPSPIPLFPLGLALGWLAVRTNGILVPVIVHGLFNAVSAVYILRS